MKVQADVTAGTRSSSILEPGAPACHRGSPNSFTSSHTPRPTPAQRRTRAPLLILVLTLAFGCQDNALTEPAARDVCTAGAECAAEGPVLSAAVVPNDPVTIEPNAVSTTGIPILILPSGPTTPVSMNNKHFVLANGLSPTHFFNSPLLWAGGTTYLDLMPDRPYTSGAWGYDINDAGAITGSGGASREGAGFVLDNGTLYRLPSPPSYDGRGFHGTDIAANGDVLAFHFRNSPSGNSGSVISAPYAASDWTTIPVPDPSNTSSST